MTERMAVNVTVFLDVPDDITEEGMDLQAEGVVAALGADYDVALNGPPVLVDYVGGHLVSTEDRRAIAADVHQERTEDARDRYEENDR